MNRIVHKFNSHKPHRRKKMKHFSINGTGDIWKSEQLGYIFITGDVTEFCDT